MTAAAAALPANAPRALVHDLGGSDPADAEVLFCRRCLIPYPQTGYLGCMAEGESFPAWYARQGDEVRKLVPVSPRNFHRFYRPMSDRLVISPDEPPKQTASGLWYPPSFVEQMRYHKPVKGTVMATGPGMLTYKGWRWPICSDAGEPIKPGSRVLFMPQGGFEIVKVEGKIYMSLRDDFILAEITEE